MTYESYYEEKAMRGECKVDQKDLEKLAMCSELAKKLDAGKCRLLKVYSGGENAVNNDLSQLTFHPNGRCGCILADDERMFEIRCDHLMWSEGYVEGIEMSDDEKCPKPGELAFIIYGNHKGWFEVMLILTGVTKEEDNK